MVYAHGYLPSAHSSTHKRPIWPFHSKKSEKFASCGRNQIMDRYGTCVSYDIHLYILHFPSYWDEGAHTVE